MQEDETKQIALIARLAKKQPITCNTQKTSLASWPKTMKLNMDQTGINVTGDTYKADSSANSLFTIKFAYQEQKHQPNGLSVIEKRKKIVILLHNQPVKTITLKQKVLIIGIIGSSLITLEEHRKNGFFYLYFRNLDSLCELIQKDKQELQKICHRKKEKKATRYWPFS